MTSTPVITTETLETLRSIPTQTLIDGLWVMGWPMSFIHGAKPLQPGQHMAGRAVTLRFVPHRPDLAADKPKGADSAEYVAFELCGPENVLVIDAMGWEYSSIGGDIKFMRLMQRRVGGLVTDGAVRDSNALKEYGFPVYSANTTAKAPPSSGPGRSMTPCSAGASWSAQGTPLWETTTGRWRCRPRRWTR